MRRHRGLIAAVVVVCAGLIPALAATRSLSFEERVAAQRAIEQVYWSHRVWPKENPGPKPALDAVLPDAQIRARVLDYMKKSNALAEVWQRPISAQQLQAEMDRMAAGSRAPDVLLEIYAALGNDPFVIAETLARQSLANRLAHDWYVRDERFHGPLRVRAEARLARAFRAADLAKLGATYTETTWKLRDVTEVDAEPKANAIDLGADEWREKLARVESVPLMTVSGLQETDEAFVVTSVLKRGTDSITEATAVWPKTPFDAWWKERSKGMSGEISCVADEFALPEMTRSGWCSPDSWTPTIFSAPKSCYHHTAIWTGSEMIVWGGAVNASTNLNTGARYNPATDTWTATSLTNAPVARHSHTAVWTGSEMIVWGGLQPTTAGGRYDPSTDTWTATTLTNVPAWRYNHTAVWTGSEMIVWGGVSGSSVNTGARYNPASDSWTATSIGTNVPSARSGHTAVWTGDEMIVWGGGGLKDGGRYNSSTNTWLPITTFGAPAARSWHTAVWTGTEMIVWGGSPVTSSGARFNPSTNIWTATTTSNAPTPRYYHSAVWSGSTMIVWGGSASSTTGLNDGGRYDPSTNSWAATTDLGAPCARFYATAVWTGSEMIVWGGYDGINNHNTGGRYDPSTNSWVSMRAGPPTSRSQHSAVWTGSEMIVWGGAIGFNGTSYTLTTTGGRYNPAIDSWSETPTTGAPTARFRLTAVWTGSEMIVWGGYGNVFPNIGGRYNPTADNWLATPVTNAPVGRAFLTAVWTGSEMIVWGGGGLAGMTNTGGRYSPSTNAWTTTSIAGAPDSRYCHTAVWTGSEMIVWAGSTTTAAHRLNSGGRYKPTTDSWTAITTSGAPAAREYHTAEWTGSEMIVWGGSTGAVQNTGGRYTPSTNSWTPTTTIGAPPARDYHSSVWTGSEMIVWGGNPLTNSGARYKPATDSWASTTTVGAPSARDYHSAVWTGSEMIVWGGSYVNTGSRYCVPCSSVYRDFDGDGHGNPSVAWSLCDGPAPAGYVGNSDDCDDADPNNFPGNFELCDNRDNNCDGLVEVPGPEACDGRDNDCNGLIDEGIAAQGTCVTGQLGVCNAGHTKCVGGSFTCIADRGPGAEICNGLDDDCDGAIDEATDSDGDGRGNCSDNCPDAYNPTQVNADGDAYGDACDCAVNDATNGRAPAVANSLRLSMSGASTGFAWQDGGVAGTYRLYRGFRNPGSSFAYNHYCTGVSWLATSATDTLAPRPGTLFFYLVSRNGCSESAVGYGVANAEIPNADPCPSTGTDADGDGLEEAADNCPGFRNGSQCDVDGDLHGDVCDNCPSNANAYQEDMDLDGLGDICDPDIDGDGFANASDNCPFVANADQANQDHDAIGDVCDPDRDGDGILEDGDASGAAGDHPCTGGVTINCDDNCPLVANANQADADADGIGDVCE